MKNNIKENKQLINNQEELTPTDNLEETKDSSIEDEENKKDPTRFGDWEVNGRAIDF